MTPIIEALSNTVLFLFLGDPPQPAGTAFLVGYPSTAQPGTSIPFVVTARHVVGAEEKIYARYSPTQSGRMAFVEYNLKDLRKSGDYFPHPDEGLTL